MNSTNINNLQHARGIQSCIQHDIRKSITREVITVEADLRGVTISTHGNAYESDNPFRYGALVTGRSFASREEEIGKTSDLIASGKNVLVRSDRRMGKSSLLAELSRQHSRDFVSIYMDLYGVTDETRFLELMTRKLMSSYQGRGGVFEPSVWELLRSTRLKLAILEQEQLTKPESDEGVLLLPPPRDRTSTTQTLKRGRPEIKMCPTCEKPLKWVEKYERFYCYSCKKYLPRQRRVKRSILVQDSFLDRICPLCGDDTFFVEKYSEYYCESCDRYPFVHLRRKVSDRFTQSDMTEVFELPQTIASDRKKPVVVMFDEFQEFASFQSRGFLKMMRDRFDLHTEATYIFTGNRGKVLNDMFEDRDAPFLKFATIVELGPITDEEMEKFLMDRFRSAEGKLEREEARRIIALSGRIPYYAQQIAHELFHISREPTNRDLEDAIDNCIALHSHACKLLWESIKSPLQRRYLIASVSEPRVPHGADFVKRHGLKSRSHVQRIENQLEARRIVSHGEVVDPMFALWLRSIADLR